jgi:hypothetical protein
MTILPKYYLLQGAAVALTGLTLENLQHRMNTTQQMTSLVFCGRGGGVLAGVLTAGLHGCAGGERFRALITGLVLLPTGAITGAIPWSPVIYSTIAIHFLQGFGIGYVKTSK